MEEKNPTSAVFCRGIVKSYATGPSKVMALRGVDLDVSMGELLLLVGPSGCGKTTLISVIAGILDLDEGQCRVFDHNMAAMGARGKTKFRGQNLGFVFQSYNLLPTLTAVENVAVPLLILGRSQKQSFALAAQLLEKVGLQDRALARPSELSGGQQQRVAIARALVHQPRLVVCDEPTSALDADTGQRVMKILRETALSENRALIIVTHDSRIFNFADRIARMDDGRITAVESQIAH
ncbi:MAG: ABC transporter ATP-binding protein [Desulfobacterales bacterium]|nr:ABC transporter ATP-binding protein [Desulfobacterales bacterium]MDD4391743.1 ABC transporter ATP-binding protein [Desulfobacterales bacterium]